MSLESDADFVVFGAAHDDIMSISVNDLIKLINKNGTVFDGRRYFSKEEVKILKNSGINYMGVGRAFE